MAAGGFPYPVTVAQFAAFADETGHEAASLPPGFDAPNQPRVYVSWGDAVETACQAGVKAIAHPGGSVRDQDAVDCCNKYGVALVTTGQTAAALEVLRARRVRVLQSVRVQGRLQGMSPAQSERWDRGWALLAAQYRLPQAEFKIAA